MNKSANSNYLALVALVSGMWAWRLPAQEIPDLMAAPVPAPVIVVAPAVPFPPEPFPPFPEAPLPPSDSSLLNYQPAFSTQDPYLEDLQTAPEPSEKPAAAEDTLVARPEAPSGFSDESGVLGAGLSAESTLRNLVDGLAYGVSFSGSYDSNVTDGGHGQARNQEDGGDFVTSLGGNLSYRTRGARWYAGGNLSGGYKQYVSRDELNGFYGSWSLTGGFTGEKLTATLTFSQSQDQGANRIYSDFVEQTSYNYGLSTSYRFGSKTTVNGTASYSTASTGDGYGDTSNLSIHLATLRNVGTRTSIGPGFRYTRQTGDIQPERTTIGPTVNFTYQASAKISVNGQVGLDFQEIEGEGSTDPSISTAIGANYRASDLWGVNLSLYRGVRADPANEGTFNEVTSLRLGYSRQIRRYSLTLGGSYEINDAQKTESSSNSKQDREFFTFDVGVSTKIFADTTQASVFADYSHQISSGAGSEFDSYTIGFRLSRGF